jgi:hypothetical protein
MNIKELIDKARVSPKYIVIAPTKVAYGQMGHWQGTETKEGITGMVAELSSSVNTALVPRKGMANAALVKGYNADVLLGLDNTPTVVDEKNLRAVRVTMDLVLSDMQEGTYGEGATRQNSGPQNPATGQSPK